MENEKSTYRTNEVLNEILDIVKKGSSDEWLTIRQAVNYTKLSHQNLLNTLMGINFWRL